MTVVFLTVSMSYDLRVFFIGKSNNTVSLDGISTLSKALCCWVRGLVCSSELESYTGSSIAAGRATHAGEVSREMPD
jgi:hypothetical protein